MIARRLAQLSVRRLAWTRRRSSAGLSLRATWVWAALLAALAGGSGAQSSAAQAPVIRTDATGVDLRLDFPPLGEAQGLSSWVARQSAAAAPAAMWSSLARPGLPALPSLSYLVALPPQGEVRLEVDALRWRSLPAGAAPELAPWPPRGEEGDVAPPAPDPAAASGTGISAGEAAAADAAAAPAPAAVDRAEASPPTDALQPHEAAPYPAVPVLVSAPAWLADRRFLRLQVLPFRWQPRAGRLEQLAGLRLRLRFEGGGEVAAAGGAGGAHDADARRAGSTPRRAATAQDGAIERLLLNPDQARVWRGRPVRPAQEGPPAPPAGPRWKLIVDQDGWYQVGTEDLVAAGIDPSLLEPGRLSLEQGGQPVALRLIGLDDGRWDPGDSLGFWGQERRAQPGGTVDFLGRPLPVMLGDARYGPDNAYVLSLAAQAGPRVQSRDAGPAALPGPPLRSLPQLWRQEPRLNWYSNHLLDDDTWFGVDWAQTGAEPSRQDFLLEPPAVDPQGGEARLTVAVRSRVAQGNEQQPVGVAVGLGQAAQPLAQQRWQGVAAKEIAGDLGGPPPVGEPLKVGVTLLPNPGASRIYLDWVSLRYDRLLKAQAGSLDLQAPAEAGRLQVTGLAAEALLALDLSDPALPVRLTGLVGGQGREGPTVDFASRTGDRRYWLGEPQAFRRPKLLARLRDDALWRPATGAEHLVLAPEAWRSTADVLAAHRRTEGISSRVLSLEAVWDQFGDGLAHPVAIQRFLAHALTHWPEPRPRYVLLVGDGHWNTFASPRYPSPPLLMPPNLVFADPYQGEVDSASRLAAVVGEDALPDLAIGRITADSAEELAAALAKTIAYERAGAQAYQAQHVFVTDCGGDASGDFVASAERLIRGALPPGAQARRLRADDFPGACSGDPAAVERLQQAIVDLLNQEGGLFASYVGHGAPNRWSTMPMFDTSHVGRLNNGRRLPILLSWTCLDGYWSHPATPSLVEDLVLGPDRGAVAAFSPTGLGLVTGHDLLWRGLYDAIYQNGLRRLGPATDLAKLRLWATGQHLDLVDTYTVFGDPALALPLPADPPSPTPAGGSATATAPAPTDLPSDTGHLYLPLLRRTG